ncbi:MAG TPA: hypothetical protein VFA63_05545 [Pseudonocardiaceae bacterium]|nr:hypothetical protein [Pseudonocardiaceae bacterium]
MSVIGHVSIEGVKVSPADVAKIPAGNLRVSRAEFVALWQAAEQCHDEQLRRGVPDWYGAGVVETCRWLAIVEPKTEPWHLAPSPVTRRTQVAYGDLIEAECHVAGQLAGSRPLPARLRSRPGWIEGVVATLNWAWRRHGSPPLDTRRFAWG